MSFPCPVCSHAVDAEPQEDWVCAACGEIHHAQAGAPAFAAVGAPGLDLAHPERHLEEGAPVPAAGDGLRLDRESAPPPPAGVRVHGRPRKFWVCFLLGIVTLGIYYAYWQLRAFGEVDRQEQARRWAWLWWLWFVFVIVAFLAVLSEGVKTGEVPRNHWTIPVAHLMFLAYIGLEARNLRNAGTARGLAMPPVGLVLALLAVGSFLQASTVLLEWPQVVGWFGFAFDALAFAILQDGMNKVWKAVYAEAGKPLPPPPLSTW